MDSIRCEGAPRALGLDQGRRCAEQVRAWFAARGQSHRARWVRPRLTGGAALGAGVGREVVRHFPHLVERMIFATGDLLNEKTDRFLKTSGRPFVEKPFLPAQIRKLVDDVTGSDGGT